jgi:sulfatase modifying factor 1
MMGSDEHYPEEAPARPVTVDGFWMGIRPVTNADFARFARQTAYVTEPERPPDAAAYPGSEKELLVPGSAVFRPPDHPVPLTDPYAWWAWVAGANWRHPQGPGSSVRKKPDHPVVHVTAADAAAYARWAGAQLPSEAEWERAARGGLAGAEYAWGNEFNPGGQWMANTWQGEFPLHNTRDDGYELTSPTGAFPPNTYGLLDMIGNVWEWTSNPYTEVPMSARACCAAPGPAGLDHASADLRSASSRRPDRIPARVIKGGSHLCAPGYCRRYRPAARMAQPVDTSTSHLGFRLSLRAPGP